MRDGIARIEHYAIVVNGEIEARQGVQRLNVTGLYLFTVE